MPSRRSLLAASGAAAVSLAGCSGFDAVSTPTVDAVEGSWPRPGFDAARTAYDSLGAGPAGDLATAWHRSLPVASPGPPGRPSPAVADGRVFVPRTGPEGTVVVEALDAATGQSLWTRERSVPVRPASEPDATLVVADGGLYLQTAAGLEAFSLDGEHRWRFDNAGGETPGRVAPPAVAGGTVYAPGFGDGAGRLYAVDAAAGTERWHRALAPDASEERAHVHGPAVRDGTVYAASRDGVVALAPDGSEQWRRSVVARAAPTVGPRRLFVPADETGAREGSLLALSPSSGETAWRRRDGVGWYAGVATDNQRVYYNGSEGVLTARSATDGRLAWTLGVGPGSDDPGGGLLVSPGTPAVVGDLADRLYVGATFEYDEGGESTAGLLVVDSDTGATIGRLAADSRFDCSPAVVDGVAFLVADGVYAVTD